MARSRVASFMSHFSTSSRSPTPTHNTRQALDEVSTSSQNNLIGSTRDSPPLPRQRTDRPPSRPTSMIQTYNPPLMEVAQDTLPELQPIFSFLNSHSNKLYQEGYFLKLNDLDSYGRPNADRTWAECFAQLVGTVLSLWDASSLDSAGQEGEVVPTFVNLTDASIKMIETLPTRNKAVAPLQNVLSISTAGKNRYLLHFNSLHSLTQWTAGIRLAMYEHATLQEAYTGSLIAGKGRTLNSINVILDRNRFKVEDWTRVRFGAGTPWRRCWCVISPPDEKALKQQQKSAKKLKSAYDRQLPVLKGDIKFYDTKKTKKAQPIATITDAYSAYAIYPQSKPLIDQSTLVKVEGTITIHSKPPSTTEGFVFVMPESHPAVSGFEIMLRWLFPVFDAFALYGRPTRLIADTLDQRGLMFAMPSDRRYGYLEILDVAGLIHTEGSSTWKEADWRKHMKDLTSKRMSALQTSGSRSGSRAGSRRGTRNSLPPTRTGIQFDDGASARSAQSHQTPLQHPNQIPFGGPPRVDSSTSVNAPFAVPTHHRSVSEAQGLDRYQNEAPPPPIHASNLGSGIGSQSSFNNSSDAINGRSSSDSDSRHQSTPDAPMKNMQPAKAPEPVASPPAFTHAPGSQPSARPYHNAELRRANSRMSSDTLAQLAGANAGGVAAAAWKASPDGVKAEKRRGADDDSHRGVLTTESGYESPADHPGVQGGILMPQPQNSKLDHRPLPPPPQRGPSPLHQMSSTQQTSPIYDIKSDFVFELPTGQPATHGNNQQLFEAPYKSRTPSPSKQVSPSIAVGGVNRERGFIPPRTDSLARPTSPNRSSFDKPLPPLQTDTSTYRKALPTHPGATKVVETPQTASSSGSLVNHVVDQAALDQVLARSQTDSTDGGRPRLIRQQTDASSNYDDDSVASPDYASTRKSTDTKRSVKSVERPRAGVMKTVGTVQPFEAELVVGETHYRSKSQTDKLNSEIPTIDFGPTVSYASGQQPNRPGTSGTLTGLQDRSSSDSKTPPNGLNNVGISPQHSPNHIPNRDSYHFPDTRRISTTQDNLRSASAASNHDRPTSMVWQPGMGSAGQQAGNRALTPEQFVQNRASQSRVSPVYAHHQKRPSSAYFRPETPTLAQGQYADPQNRPHSRNNSNEPYSVRPQSRGTSYSPTPPDYAARLSAREQEHVARVTGSPLINMAGGPSNRQQTQGGGLIGAIEAREREKKDIKQGISGHMVQHAIQQRQQQAQGYGYGQQQGQFQTPQPGQNQIDAYGRPVSSGSMGFPTPPGQNWGQQGSNQGITPPVGEGQGFGSNQQQQQFGGFYGQAR
ncbi:MAG: hypothetical protein M1814_000159 [Vezdaea aestivalis]|nr:MAG: hypothetical protein M1814_000159 [Vezdaea aestivalis]